MPNSAEWQLKRHVAYLRRYARALAGEQERADAAILMTLNSLTKPDQFAADVGYREQLYTRFSRIWNGPDGKAIRSNSASARREQQIDRSLADVPSLAKQAFLLCAMEDFPDYAIARILSLDLQQVASLKEMPFRKFVSQRQ